MGLVHAIEAHTGVAWTELELEGERVGEIMVQVNTLYREAELKLGSRTTGGRVGRSMIGRGRSSRESIQILN